MSRFRTLVENYIKEQLIGLDEYIIYGSKSPVAYLTNSIDEYVQGKYGKKGIENKRVVRNDGNFATGKNPQNRSEILSYYMEMTTKHNMKFTGGPLKDIDFTIPITIKYRVSDHDKLNERDKKGLDVFVPNIEKHPDLSKYLYYDEKAGIDKYKINKENIEEYTSAGCTDIDNKVKEKLMDRANFMVSINRDSVLKDLLNLSDQDFISKYKMTNKQHEIFFEPWFCSFLIKLKKNMNQNTAINNVGMGQR